jgi:hypothetical protein
MQLRMLRLHAVVLMIRPTLDRNLSALKIHIVQDMIDQYQHTLL